MSIRVDCTTCRKWYKAPEKVAGKVVKCPGCGGDLAVPAAGTVVITASKTIVQPRPPVPPPPAPAPPPHPDLPPLDEDDPFAALGFPPVPAGARATAPASTSPASKPGNPRPSTVRLKRPARKGFDAAAIASNIGRFVVANPLITSVGLIAGLLLALGTFVHTKWFVFNAAMALAGGGLIALGLLVPPPKPRSRAAASSKRREGGMGSLFNPFAAGGMGLLGLIGVVAKALGRVNLRANQGGGDVARAVPGREADPATLALGLAVIALVIGSMVGLFYSIRRYGLYATLAPIYVFFGGLLTLVMLTVMGGEIAGASRPGGWATRPQPPLVGGVDPSSAAGGRPELLNRSPLTPLAAGPLSPQVREGSPLPGILRRAVTIDSPFGVLVKKGRLEVYEPVAARGAGQERKWPCVLLAPAGSNLLAGQELGDGDHAEALPWARAGYVVVQYSLPGAIADPERVTALEAKRAFAEFSAARAGLGCVEQALAYVKTELPQVDPKRIAAVGHSSAGTLALLAAESNPEIKACVAFAPCTDVTEFHRDNFAVLEPVIPTVRKFSSDYSPINHVDQLQCPLFLFQAEDDSVTPLAGAIRFVEAAQGKKNLIEFVRVPTGNHYDSMVGEGIPAAIRWLDATFARATAPRPPVGE